METIRTMETMNTENQEMTFEEVHELVKNMSLPQANPLDGALMITCLNGNSSMCCSGRGAVIASMLYAAMNKNEGFARTVLIVASRFLCEQASENNGNNKNNGNNE